MWSKGGSRNIEWCHVHFVNAFHNNTNCNLFLKHFKRAARVKSPQMALIII